MKKKYCLLLVLLMVVSFAKAQDTTQMDDTGRVNLVYNGSFEENRNCPKKVDAVGILTLVEGWYQPTRGSADYFNVCGSRECGIPVNKLGTQSPHDGDAYCGIYCSKNDYREYLQTQLRRRLHKGDSIQVSYYVSLSEQSTGAVSTLGALFTPTSIGDTVRSLLLHKEVEHLTDDITQVIATVYEPQVVNPIDTPLIDTRQWQKISGTFVAEGGERYVTLGNFYPAELSGYHDLDSLAKVLPGAYYYIDDVTIECLNCRPPVTDDQNIDSTFLTTEQPAFNVGGSFVMKEIFFEFDKSTLLQQSYFELMNLLSLLKAYPKMRIEIGGYTDSKGTDSYNLRLSENRAKAVYDYLIMKGVSEKRLLYKGYGKERPIASNDTEEGRSANRRVEFKIVSM